MLAMFWINSLVVGSLIFVPFAGVLPVGLDRLTLFWVCYWIIY